VLCVFKIFFHARALHLVCDQHALRLLLVLAIAYDWKKGGMVIGHIAPSLDLPLDPVTAVQLPT